MARYFFNIYDGQDILDDIGTELDDVHAARRFMLVTAKDWIERKEHQDTHWFIEARDDNENIVGSMRFGVIKDNS